MYLYSVRSKKHIRIVALSILTAVLICCFCGCGNKSPVVGGSSEQSGETDSKEQTIPDYIKGDDLAMRSYELRFLLAQKKFNSPDDIAVNALVQYSFCHLFYDNLIDIPNSGSKLRKVSEDGLRARIKKDFGEVKTDITKSDLYNASKKCFEMWEPPYETEIFYDVSLDIQGSNTYRAYTTFYTDSTESEILGKTVLTVRDNDGQIVIMKMTSSN